MGPPDDAAATRDAQWLASRADTELASRMDNGFKLELVGFPPRSSAGVDLRAYGGGVTAMLGVPVAPVVHVVSLFSSGDDGPPSSTCVSAFVSARRGETVRVEYDPALASLRCVTLSTQSENGVHLGDRGVAIYTQPHENEWHHVAGYISEHTVKNLTTAQLGEPLMADAMEEVVSSETELQTKHDIQCLQIHPLPRLKRLPGMTPSQVTQFNVDRTAYITWLISTRHRGKYNTFLAELQIAFVAFLLVRSLSALRHWCSMVVEVSACYDLVSDAPSFVDNFLTAVAYHLQAMHPDVLSMDPHAEVVSALSDFAHRCTPSIAAADTLLRDLRSYSTAQP